MKQYFLLSICLLIFASKSMDEEPSKQENDGIIASLDYSPDGKRIAMGQDFKVAIWDIEQKKYTHEFKNEDVASSVKFFKDNVHLIATIGASPCSMTIKVWNIITGESTQELKDCFKGTYANACSDDGVFCLHTDDIEFQSPILWNIEKRECVKTFEASKDDTIVALALSNGTNFCATGGTGQIIKIFDVSTGQETNLFIDTSEIAALAFSSDTKTLISSTQCAREGIKLWDISSGKIIQNHINSYAGSLACSSDDTTIAYSGIDGVVHYFDIRKGESDVKNESAIGSSCLVS